MAISGTQHLQHFLARVAGSPDSEVNISPLKAENLNIKNVYIGRDNKVHVSNNGFYRWIAEKGGRATGAEAFKQAMEQAMKPTLGKAGMLHAGGRILDNLMGRIAEHQEKHSSWEIRNRAQEAGVGQAAGKEPTKALGQLLNEATAEEKFKDLLKDAHNAGVQDAESFVKSCAGDPNPLDKLKARLGIYEGQRANAGNAAKRPGYEYKENKMQAETMRSLDPKLEMARLDGSISVITSQIIIKEHPTLSKIEQQIQNFEVRMNDALKDVSVRNMILNNETQDAVEVMGIEIFEDMQKWGKETIATMKDAGLPEREIEKFTKMLEGKVAFAANGMQSLKGGSWAMADTAMQLVGRGHEEKADALIEEKADALIGQMADFAPKVSPAATFAYKDIAMKGLLGKLASCQLTEKELGKFIDDKMSKYADIVARAKDPAYDDGKALTAELFPVMDEDLTSGMATSQQFEYYAASLFGDKVSVFQKFDQLPTADKATQSDIEAMKKVSKDRAAAGEYQLNAADSLKTLLKNMGKPPPPDKMSED